MKVEGPQYVALFEGVYSIYETEVFQEMLRYLSQQLAASPDPPDVIYMYSISPAMFMPMQTMATVQVPASSKKNGSMPLFLVRTKSAYGCQALLMTRKAAKILLAFNAEQSACMYTSDGVILRPRRAR